MDKSDKVLEAFTHLEQLKRKVTGPIMVALGGPPRPNALIKDSQWVQDRKSIVDKAAEDTLLITTEGDILEGSQTNFFAVLPSGVVYTAGKGILEGTVRAVVLDACRSLGIPLILEAPKVEDLKKFSEAFLASTSRLVMPIDILGDHTLPTERPVTARISEWVIRHVADRSISVHDWSNSNKSLI